MTFRWERWSPLAGVLAVVGLFVALPAALRTGLLPRWFGWLGIVVGVIQLFAIVFIPVFVYWAWILLAALLLLWKDRAPVRTG